MKKGHPRQEKEAHALLSIWNGRISEKKEPGPPPALWKQLSTSAEALSASFSSSPLFAPASSLSSWVLLSSLFSLARLSFSRPFSVRASVLALPLPAPRLRLPAPLLPSRLFPATRRPALRRLPAVTAHCRLRNYL